MIPARLKPSAATRRAVREVWRSLPEEIKQSTTALATRRIASRAINGHPLEEPRIIRSLGELDEMIGELEVAVRLSDDDLRRGFQSFRMELNWPTPDDPFSPAYRESMMECYEWLHGGPYSPDNETTLFDLQSAIDRPFPYFTGSPVTTGEYTMGVGHLIRTLDLRAGSRVLELGSGWGNVCLPLAQMGCQMTTVDVCPGFVELVRARAERLGVEVDARLGDFYSVEEPGRFDGRFDATVFFESFHHCDDHYRLLSALDGILTPQGRIVFAAEPVDRRFWKPWGLRLDGESLWAIRRNGWLELGFQRSYFLEALRRTGWRAELVPCPSTPWGRIWVATRT